MAKGDLLGWQLLLLLVLILISGFFSCSEIAIISLNKNKLEKMFESGRRNPKGSRRAGRILSLLGQPSKFFATIQVGSILAGFLASAFAASSITGRLTNWFIALGTAVPLEMLKNISMVIITMILSFVQMVLGELVPRRIAMKYADTIAFSVSTLILFISRLFAPIVWLLTKTTNGILRLLGINPEADAYIVTEEEIRLMIDVGSSRGTIDDGEKEMLQNVFEFGSMTTGDVMTHRRDTVLLRLADKDSEWERLIMESRHSFFPVCGESMDDIAGVLKSRDYLCFTDRSRETVMAQAVVPAQFIPTSVKADVLFKRMKKNRNHFAVVLDEHGSLMGVVTMKDLLEELVGNLDDDDSIPPLQPLVEKTGPDTWIVNGMLPLDKAAREFAVALPVEQYDTFAGFVFSLLGRIPEDGSQAELEVQGLKIRVLEIRERRLEKAQVALIEKSPAVSPE